MKTGITLEEALAIVRESYRPASAGAGVGEELLGRVLAENIIAPMDQPPFDRSPLDGYALASTDTQGRTETTPSSWRWWTRCTLGAGHRSRFDPDSAYAS